MQEFNAERFVRILVKLTLLQAWLVPDPPGGGPKRHAESIIGVNDLVNFRDDIQALSMDTATVTLDRLIGILSPKNPGNPTGAELAETILELERRVKDQLRGRAFLYLTPNERALFEAKQPPFGHEVAARFPLWSEDIEEASKCLALGRATAAVFHTMRVLESGVQELWRKLQVPAPMPKNWQNLLDQANKQIKTLDQQLPETRAYAESAAHLYHVKLAWRNEVMHPKQTYTLEEANSVFLSSRVFVRHLATIL